MRCPFAIWRPGPPKKQGYSFYWTFPELRGLVHHSMDGWRLGAESRLFGPDDASWTFSNYQDGTLEQHYETGATVWHCGYPGNLYYDGVEHEGKNQPLTDAQYANTLRLTKWYFENHPEWGAPELRKNLQEHGWLWPTACPSGRIPWARLIADMQEEEVSLTINQIRALIDEETNYPLLIQPAGRKEIYELIGDTLSHVENPETFVGKDFRLDKVRVLPVTHEIWQRRVIYPLGVPAPLLLPGVS